MIKGTATRRALRAAIAIVAVIAVAGVAPAATAAEYPSWADVESARSTESGKQTQIVELTALIDGLTSEVDAAQAEADSRASEYERAQTSYDAATLRATNLQTQADEATVAADESAELAGRFAATLARSGNTDLSMTLFLEGSGADDLLHQLGSMSKLTERLSVVYDAAAEDRNAATSLTDQATIARDTLGDLAEEAQTAFDDALAATARVEAALADQQENAGVLQAQLAVLTEDRAATEADYATGEQIRIAAEAAAAAERARVAAAAEAARVQAAAAERARAAAAAASAPASAPAASNPSRPSTPVASGQGWVAPSGGYVSSSYGPRPQRPVPGVGAFHYGTDLAVGCGTGVYAVTGGTVVSSGWLGSYGNWVLIDHGNGVQTGYAHNSTNLVSRGQQVSAGQTIALIGTTGASTGCHLHFETRVNGARINPQPFMAARGVRLG